MKHLKHIIYFIFISSLFNDFPLHSQNWNKVGNGLNLQGWVMIEDTSSDRLLVAGDFSFLGGACSCNNFAWWNGASWSFFSDSTGPRPRAITKYQGDIYCGTFNFYPASVQPPQLCKLGNNKWLRTSKVHGNIYDLNIINGKLYAAGTFDSIGGIKANDVAYYDGVWHAIDTTSWEFPEMDRVIGYNNEIYVIGNFRSHDHTIRRMAKWNGVKWSNVGGNVFGYAMGVPRTMSVYKNKLYVGGTFSKSFGNPGNSLARWNGTSWDSIPGIYHPLGYGTVFDMKIYHDKLILGGEFKYADTVASTDMVAWDDTKFLSFGVHKFDLPVLNIGFYRDRIYVLCGDSIDNMLVNGIAYYDGTFAAVENIQASSININIYPNPFSNQILISSNGNYKNVKIQIHNVLGQLVYCSDANLEEEIKISTEKFCPGFYHLSITQNNENIFLKKLIKVSD